VEEDVLSLIVCQEKYLLRMDARVLMVQIQMMTMMERASVLP
jgi:hypothetical protein